MGPLSCIDSKKDVKQSHHKAVDQAARFFCEGNAKGISQNYPNVHKTIAATESSAEAYSGTESKDDVYDIAITQLDQEQFGQDTCLAHIGVTMELDQPIPDYNCEGILTRIWQDCNNNGRGGSITVGCFVYSITAKY
ncbi:MAG: hypothetical protein LQ342_003995 [Letrouitia transgressa]|nr:MAG: hypothetical protein LQ342_003995 [Letrouitia transgressa]